MSFSELVYKGIGPHQRKGGTFDCKGVKSEDELLSALSNGWFKTLPEAIEDYDNPVVKEVAAEVVESVVPEKTIRQQAKELGILFGPRTSEETLKAKIKEALAK